MSRWLPLESNPESMNKWSASLGLDTTAYSFQDCWGLDAEMLSYVQRPVKAVLMLFPITNAYEAKRKEQDEEILQNGVEGVEDVIYFKQTIANACGSYALLHSLANAGLPLSDDSPLKALFERCQDKSPFERSGLLEQSKELSSAHEASAQGGQTAVPDLQDDVDLHFVAFINHDGSLIELDGRRNSPINHGKIVVDLLEDTVEVVKNVIEISGSLQFNLITLSPTPKGE